MKIAFEIMMPASNNTENVAQYLIMQKQHQHSRVSHKQTYDSLYNKTNRCTNFPNLFWLKNEPQYNSGSSSAHHQESINCTLGTGVFEDSFQAVFKHTSAKCTVNRLLMMGRGTARNM